jgi:GT2 family glycosyltransferase
MANIALGISRGIHALRGLLQDAVYAIRVGLGRNPLSSPAGSQSVRFSILLPVHCPKLSHLRKAIGSVIGQDYSNWELCITDDGSRKERITTLLGALKDDSRIKIVELEQSRGIAIATNSSIAMATGDWMVFLDHDDLLTRDALGQIAAVIEGNPGMRLIYSDEDKISTWGWRFDPYFKPDWSPDLLLSQNYLCHLVAVRADLVRELDGISEGLDGAQDWDFVLRATERCGAEEIHHIPHVLYHWRAVRGSTARSRDSKPAVPEVSKRALREACIRRGVAFSDVEMVERGGHFRIKRLIPEPCPLVSVVIPVRNKPELLQKCLLGLHEKTDYPALEILVVDNDSDDLAMEEIYLREGEKIRLLRESGPFNFSAMNNHAVREANGEILLLLNNDVEPLDPDWLYEMVSQAVRPEIGAVGPLLVYPDGRVQHAGITLGIAGPMRKGGVAGHPGKYMRPDARVMGNLLNVTRNVSAVTGACLAIRKKVYLQVGGFDEKDLTIAFNDVDFCIRVMKAGYRNLWTPHARLTHHESASRGSEDSPEKIARFQKEVAIMRERWGDLLDNDPNYNPNLTLVHENWGLEEAPRYNRS